MPVRINNPLLQYHPIRFYEIRKDFIAEPMNILLSAYKSGTSNMFSIHQDIHQAAWCAYVTQFIEQVESSNSKEGYPTYVRKMHRLGKIATSVHHESEMSRAEEFFDFISDSEYTNINQYVSFSIGGNNIFEFSPSLLDFFAKTDVDNVLLKDIRLPFQTIYLHFGRQEGKEVNGDISSVVKAIEENNLTHMQENIRFLLDGAYITQCPDTGALTITVTSVKNKNTKYTNNFIDSYEDTSVIVLKLDSINTNIRDAALSQRKVTLEYWEKEIQRKKDEGIPTKLYFSEAVINARADKAVEYLKLIINCVLYLQSYPDDIEEDYTLEAPRNLVQQTLRAPGAATAAHKKLSQLGYRKIKFCGRKNQKFWQDDEESEEPALVEAVSNASKRNAAPHKRRAHIRRQRYGKELQSWRYVWIKEATIHKEKYYEAPALYRVYEVAD